MINAEHWSKISFQETDDNIILFYANGNVIAIFSETHTEKWKLEDKRSNMLGYFKNTSAVIDFLNNQEGWIY